MWFLIWAVDFLLIIVCMSVVGNWLARRQQQADGQLPKPISVLSQELVHEIRNPLNSISLNLQLLEEDLSGMQEDLQKRVRRIRGEVERLDQILTDFRRYAKLPPLNLETADLAMLIEEVLDFNEPESQRRNIEVVREIYNLPPIQLDAMQFKQALLNLIINANQAMEDGGKLMIRARSLNGQVQIDVEDTGEGIPVDMKNQIFELFVSTKDDGTGVGLAIAKQIVEGHGGNIEVESQPNQGTTFSIRLPIK